MYYYSRSSPLNMFHYTCSPRHKHAYLTFVMSLHCYHVCPFVSAFYRHVPSLFPCLSLCPGFLLPRPFIAPMSLPLYLLPTATSLHYSHVSPFFQASYCHVLSLLPCLSLCICFLLPRPFIIPMSLPLSRLPTATSFHCSHVSPFVSASYYHVPSLFPCLSLCAPFILTRTSIHYSHVSPFLPASYRRVP